MRPTRAMAARWIALAMGLSGCEGDAASVRTDERRCAGASAGDAFLIL